MEEEEEEDIVLRQAGNDKYTVSCRVVSPFKRRNSSLHAATLYQRAQGRACTGFIFFLSFFFFRG